MPFVAIALAISLFLGGSAAVATTPAGHTAMHNMGSFWSHVEAKVTGQTDTDTSTTVESTNDATSTSQMNDALRVRTNTDASVNATATDSSKNTDGSLKTNADGSVKVNIF